MWFDDGLTHESYILLGYSKATFDAETSSRWSYSFYFLLSIFFDRSLDGLSNVRAIDHTIVIIIAFLWNDWIIVSRIEVVSAILDIWLFTKREEFFNHICSWIMMDYLTITNNQSAFVCISSADCLFGPTRYNFFYFAAIGYQNLEYLRRSACVEWCHIHIIADVDVEDSRTSQQYLYYLVMTVIDSKMKGCVAIKIW